MKPIPPYLTFSQALTRGYIPRMENRAYMNWVKTLNCVSCNRPADDPHHPYGIGLKGGATKVPDWLVIPMCRNCHDALHHNPDGWEDVHGQQIKHAAMTLLQAIHEGKLKFHD